MPQHTCSWKAHASMHASKTVNCSLLHTEGKFFTISSYIHQTKLPVHTCKCACTENMELDSHVACKRRNEKIFFLEKLNKFQLKTTVVWKRTYIKDKAMNLT